MYGSVIIIGLTFKIAYDIGYFDAQALKKENSGGQLVARPVLTLESAQRIVTGALKEDQTNPKTVVTQIFDNNQKLSSLIIEKDKQQKVAWIIDMCLFFTGNLLNDDGYNLNEGIEKQNNISRSRE